MDDLKQPLAQMDTPAPSARALMTSFVAMACCFSVNHGCVTAVLGLASSDLGEVCIFGSSAAVGDISLGILYLMYTLTALLGSTALVGKFGHKGVLFGGTLLYCAYVLIFLLVQLKSVKDNTSVRVAFVAIGTRFAFRPWHLWLPLNRPLCMQVHFSAVSPLGPSGLHKVLTAVLVCIDMSDITSNARWIFRAGLDSLCRGCRPD